MISEDDAIALESKPAARVQVETAAVAFLNDFATSLAPAQSDGLIDETVRLAASALARDELVAELLPRSPLRSSLIRSIRATEEQLQGLLVIRDNAQALETWRAARESFRTNVLPVLVKAAIAAVV